MVCQPTTLLSVKKTKNKQTKNSSCGFHPTHPHSLWAWLTGLASAGSNLNDNFTYKEFWFICLFLGKNISLEEGASGTVVKMSFGTPASHIGVRGRVPGSAPNLNLLINGNPGRQLGMVHVLGSHRDGRPRLSSRLLASAWCSAGCCRHSGNEPANGRRLFVSLAFKWNLKINKYLKN